MAGFGHSNFGHGPFGKSDLGYDLVVKLFPEEWLGIDLPNSVDRFNNDQDPLLQMLKTFANSVNKRRNEVDELSTLVDYETMQLDLLRMMGRSLGLNIDKNEPEFIQRSFVGNASQWLQIKASTQGYSVRGRASGFDVLVENFWRIDPSYAPFIPLRNLYNLKPKGADPNAPKWLHCDQPPGTFVGTPLVEDETYAKSSWVRVAFVVAEPRRIDVDYNMLLDLVILKITDVVGIHHELMPLEFRSFLNVNISVSVNMLIDEGYDQVQVHEFKRFDIIPADELPLDDFIVQILTDNERAEIYQNVFIPLGINNTHQELVDGDFNLALSATMTGSDEEQLFATVPLLANIFRILSELDAAVAVGTNISTNIVQSDETINAANSNLNLTSTGEVTEIFNVQAQVSYTYDFIPSDQQPLDGPISVDMTIQII